MNSDQAKSKAVHTPGSVSTNTSNSAVQEPLRPLNDDTTVQTVAKSLHKSLPQTETDSAEKSPSSLPSWTVQGYKVSTEKYYRNPSELMIVASLAIVAENADFRT